MDTTTLAGLTALLLTYLLHSTLLLGAVWALDRLVVRQEAWRETLWKAALLGAVITTAMAAVLPARLAPRIDFASPAIQAETADAFVTSPGNFDREAASSGVAEQSQAAGDRTGAAATREDAVLRGPAESEMATTSNQTPMASDGESNLSWMAILLGTWAAVAGLLLLRLGFRHLRLYRLLRGRREVTEAGLPAVLAELRRTAGVWRPVRLTATPAIATPLVLGAREICVPDQFLTGLTADQQRAALAHELGHLARRDPTWQLGAMLLECVFFFQPLHRVARLRLRESAEYLADGWAVQYTGSRLGLARCLAEVAGWVAPSDEPVLAGTVAMAEGGSPLLVRVSRLLEREPEASPRRGLRGFAAVALIGIMAAFAPAITPAEADASPEGTHQLDTDSDVDSDRDQETDGSISEPEIIRMPTGLGPADALRWAGSAERENASISSSPYWVAWAVKTRKGIGRMLISDSAPWSEAELKSPSLAAQIGLSGELWDDEGIQKLIILARVVPGTPDRPTRLAVRSSTAGMQLDAPLYWAGLTESGASFDWLQTMFRSHPDAGIRETALEAIGYHPDSPVGSFLRELVGSSEGSAVRQEAVEALGSQQDTTVAAFLLEVALNDPDAGVRREAVEAMGELPAEAAGPVLRRVLRESRYNEDRREALEQLADLGPRAGYAVDELVATAMSDDDPELRREAVELLADLPPPQAVVALRRVAFQSGDGTSERQAAESLGQVGTPEALAVLDEILARNPSEDASFQAVEAIAENFSRELAGPRLRRIAREHPSSRVRKEALDYLVELDELDGL